MKNLPLWKKLLLALCVVGAGICAFYGICFVLVLLLVEGNNAAKVIAAVFALVCFGAAVLLCLWPYRVWHTFRPSLEEQRAKMDQKAKEKEEARQLRNNAKAAKDQEREEKRLLRQAEKEEAALQKNIDELAKTLYCPREEIQAYLEHDIAPKSYDTTPVLLRDDERVLFYGKGVYEIVKNKAVGRTGGGCGVSVRVAKGVTLRTGSTASQTVYRDVAEEYGGDLVVTNQRVIFLNLQKGFEVKVQDVTAVSPIEGAHGLALAIQAKTKGYTVCTGAHDLLVQVLRPQ